MWPWGHAAVAYLLYRLILVVRRDGNHGAETGSVSTPTGPAVLALGVGTQFPDLIDKPLAWSVSVLPSGRTLAHSALVWAAIAVVALAIVTRYGSPPDGARSAGTPAADGGGGTRRLPTWLSVPTPTVTWAFLFGYGSHLLSDLPPSVLTGDVAGAGYLLWPVVPAVVYAGEESWAAHFPPEVTAFALVQIGLAVVAVAVWVSDGSPGLDTLRRLAS
jgi:xanthine/uracil permease